MRNRLLLLLLLLVSLHTLSAQGDGRDYRAVLDVRGRMNEISVSPNGRIWLTTLLGDLYYANAPGTDWHYGSLTGEVKRKDEKDYWKIDFRAPDLDRITFFNNDTAILSGFIYGEPQRKNTGDTIAPPTADGPGNCGISEETNGSTTRWLTATGTPGWSPRRKRFTILMISVCISSNCY